MVGIVAVMLILNIIPMILVPMQQASSTQITSYGDANWTTAFNSVKTAELNSYTMMSTTPTVQTVILILAVVLAVA
jgi:preprotein translocase subunit SecG